MSTTERAYAPGEEPVSRDDLEAKMRQLQASVEETGETARSYAAIVGVAVGVVALGLVFLLGKRRGRSRETVVEIRRI